MAGLAPCYYTGLAPFRALFATGLPVLTYHHLGPRPRGVRLKGLYLPAPLFGRQLEELRAAGFVTAPLEAAALGAAGGGARVVLTFDDGFRDVLEHGLGPLAAPGFQAVQFLVAERLGQTNAWDAPLGEVVSPLMTVEEVRAWLAAGHAIGSHSLTHPHLTRLPPATAREEIAASKKQLEDQFGVPVRHFCYPYGDWNPAVRELVGEAGYQTACTTLFGVNESGRDPLTLRRITARYRTRKLSTLWPRRQG